MTSRTARRLIACAFLSVLFVSNALADDCKLGRIVSMDFTESGAIVIPITLDGTKVPMALDTGAPLSAVDPIVAKNLGLTEKRVYQSMYDSKGEIVTYLAVVHNLGIGTVHGDDVKMIVWPSPMSRDGRIAGTLGADLLRNYDIDIDFGARKLNLFSQDHCPGQVVYWPNNGVAVVPIHVVNTGHIVLPVNIDGHDLDAVLDLGSTRSLMSMEFAHNLFGLDSTSPGMEKTGQISGAVQTDVYRHQFKNLSLQGLAIGNPTFFIWDNLIRYSANQSPPTGSRMSVLRETEGHTDVTLGLAELNRLHVYIAYKEQKLYMTAASAPLGVAATAPPTAAANEPAAAPSSDGASH